MKKLKFYNLLAVLIIALSISSCHKDMDIKDKNPISQNGDDPLELRYTLDTIQGMIQFDNYTHFREIDSTNMLKNDSQMDSWRSTFPLQTAGKAWVEFADYSSDTYPSTLISANAGLLVVEDQEKDTSKWITVYQQRYKEYYNANHVFAIGNDVIKVSTSGAILMKSGLINGDWTNEVSFDPDSIIALRWPPSSCCVNANKTKDFTNNGHKKRLCIERLSGGDDFSVGPISFWIEELHFVGVSYIRKGALGIKWWAVQKVTSSHTATFDIDIDWPSPFADVSSNGVTATKTNSSNQRENRLRFTFMGPTFNTGLPPTNFDPNSICVDNVTSTYNDTYNSQSITLDCTP